MPTHDAHAEISFSLQDLVAVVRRRLWWFAIPTGLAAALAGGVAMWLPPIYEAETRVQVQPQSVPEVLVQSTIVGDSESQFAAIKARIETRDSLLGIIQDFDLYADLDESSEDKVERMRANTTIAPLPPPIVDPRKPMEIHEFRIAFRGDDPDRVAEIANRLTRDFLAADLRERTTQAEGTTEFIDSELEKTLAERERIGDELAAYKEEHAGELPEDLRMNSARLERLTQARNDALAALDGARRQVTEIRRQIHEIRTSGTDETADPVARKRTLEIALSRYRAEGKTEKHPDIVIARAELAEIEALIQDSVETDAPLSPAEVVLRNELRNYEVRVEVMQGEIARLDAEIAPLTARVGSTPQHAAYLDDLQTEYQTLTRVIMDLQQKKTAADMGQAVELVQKGRRFRQIETAVPPTSPIEPNRPLYFLVGTLVGLILGLFLGVVREITDQSFHTATDLQDSLELPVLGAIPVIELPAELARTRARLRRAVVGGAVVLALLAGGTLLVYLLNGGGGTSTAATPGIERHV